jgi:HD superfamily phosphohydrolase
MELARRWARQVCTDPHLIDLIALTGLYHDIGHVALSHTMDQKLVEMGLADHEVRSTNVLRRVNARIRALSSTDEDFVCDAIRGFYRAGSAYPPWAYHVVHQPDRALPDVDRVVYLSHDLYKLDRDRHIDSQCLLDGLFIHNGDLAFHQSCHDQLREIIEVRDMLFQDVYMHPRVTAYQRWILQLFCNTVTLGVLANWFASWEWLQLTDVKVWACLETDPYYTQRLPVFYGPMKYVGVDLSTTDR